MKTNQTEKIFRYYAEPTHTEHKGTRHTIVIRIRTRDIDSRQHHFHRDKVTSNIFMDGTRFFGSEGIPGEHGKYEIYPEYMDSVTILWDGKVVPLKKNDFKHLVHVPLRWGISLSYASPRDNTNLFLQVPQNNDVFLLRIGGGDGAGSFQGYWMVSRQGVVGFTAEGPA